jgi:hypothetical protein
MKKSIVEVPIIIGSKSPRPQQVAMSAYGYVFLINEIDCDKTDTFVSFCFAKSPQSTTIPSNNFLTHMISVGSALSATNKPCCLLLNRLKQNSD